MPSIKKHITAVLPKSNPLRQALSTLFHYPEKFGLPKIDPHIDNRIRRYVDAKPTFNFIQIGSNNGSLNDPLYPFFSQYPCHGILIEPVPYIFEELKKTYANFPQLHCENIAIANYTGTMDFYIVKKSDDPTIPSWYNQLSSFDPNYILKHKKHIPQLEHLIVKQQVPCSTLQHVVKKYNIHHLDILHIDTEGYDYEIIKTINFDTLHPAILMFEHNHLKTSTYRECLRLLKKHYRTIYRNNTWDTICFDPK